MENRRFVLLALLAVVGFFLYQAWQKDYPVQPAVPSGASPSAAAPEPSAPTAMTSDLPVGNAPATADAPRADAGFSDRIHVVTDVQVAEISLRGGDLRRIELTGYPVSKAKDAKPLALLNDRDGQYFVLEAGVAGESKPLATYETQYESAQRRYELAAGQESLDVVLESRESPGLLLRKVYRFRRGSYEVTLLQAIMNQGDAELAAGPYVRFVSSAQGTVPDPPLVQSFRGLGVYQQKPATEKYTFQKTVFDDLDDSPIEVRQKGGWLAVLQHYFLAAVLPAGDEELIFSGKANSAGRYVGQYVGPLAKVAPQAESTFTTRLYLGPNLQGSIKKVAPGLELTQDYGILTPIAEPLFWTLEKFFKLTHNWGVAIILLTLVVKALMYKLSEAQYRSMAKMRKFAPRIQEIKERFAEDRERLNKAMMDLYKKEGFNPLAGCWPLLVQFPVFIALYWVLSQSVELRQAEFALWIHDLSAADPFYVLPVLFGLSMWVQQKLSGQTMPDPTQQRIMNLMPIMMTAFFAFFASGLVLYWLVSNLVGILQQWYITRKLERLGLA